MKHFADLAFLKLWVRISSLFIVGIAMGQDIGVGTWRTHFNYTNAQLLTASDNKVFCAAQNGLFSWDVNEQTVRKLSKLDGLSDVGVSAMRYDPSSSLLVIGYRSGRIDFVFEDGITSITDIANSNLEGDKTINAIAFGGGNTFAATDLGVVVFRSDNASIQENYVQIGSGGAAVQIHEVLYRNDSLFIRTNQGIQSGQLSSNLLDFNNWTRYAGTSTIEQLSLVSGMIYGVQGSSLVIFDGVSWADTGADLPGDATKLFSSSNVLLATTSDGTIYEWNGTSFLERSMTSNTNINAIAFDNEGNMFIADAVRGLRMEGSEMALSPEGPLSDSYSNVKAIRNEVYGFHAPNPFTYDGSEQVAWYSLFAEGSWTLQEIDAFSNVSDVALFNSNRYFTSIGDGLYDEANGAIITDIPSSASLPDTMLTSIEAKDRLWIAGIHPDEAAHFMNEDGTWMSYPVTRTSDNAILSVDLAETGVAWLGNDQGSITVIDADQDIVDFLTTSDGLPSDFNDIVISIEDDAWVVTPRGPAVFEGASFVLNDQRAIIPTFENRILFEDENINAVMTDGGNRVWFGTDRGLWVFDENTSEQVALFNESNSPIPSNTVLKLAYNGRNGEVFIVTDKGMVSYRSASSIGNRDHRDVSVFPNPVRPDYQGMVGISGLAKNASLKVTDVNGNLVNELQANGGSASWDLMDIRGGKVATGIYYFFSSSSDGEETYVGKVAVIR